MRGEIDRHGLDQQKQSVATRLGCLSPRHALVLSTQFKSHPNPAAIHAVLANEESQAKNGIVYSWPRSFLLSSSTSSSPFLHKGNNIQKASRSLRFLAPLISLLLVRSMRKKISNCRFHLFFSATPRRVNARAIDWARRRAAQQKSARRPLNSSCLLNMPRASFEPVIVPSLPVTIQTVPLKLSRLGNWKCAWLTEKAHGIRAGNRVSLSLLRSITYLF